MSQSSAGRPFITKMLGKLLVGKTFVVAVLVLAREVLTKILSREVDEYAAARAQ